MTESANESSVEVAETPLPRPSVATERLRLRPFSMNDAGEVQRMANDREIAANTRTIPHPYPMEVAREWLGRHEQLWNEGKAAVFAIEITETGQLCGAIGLEISDEHQSAELGYWVGREFWNRGICSEAGLAVLRFGFESLGLHRIHAHYLTRNPASGRVMEKIGMKKEGLLREHVRKWGRYEDVQFYGILRSEFS